MPPLNANPPERVLILLLGAIGDVVRALPLLQRVREGWPQARITWAVEPIAEPIVRGHASIDEVLVFDRPGGVPAFLRFLGELRRQRFDLVIDLQRHLKSGLASRATGAARRIGFARGGSREGNWLFQTEHAPEMDRFSSKLGQFLRFGDALGLPPVPTRFGLVPTAEERARAAAWLPESEGPWAAAFVGSTWESRWWWPASTAEALRRLEGERGVRTVLVGAPSEATLAAEVMATAPPGTRNLVGETQLRDLLAIFERCRLAFGPDSGPMHMAAAMGLPVVSLWGATSPARSAPFASEDLAVVGEVECHPCYRKQCPIGKKCMTAITPERVWKRLELGLVRSDS